MAAQRQGPSATVRDIQADVQELRADLARLAEQVTGLVAETGGEALGDVRNRIQKIRDGLQNIADKNGHEAVGAVFEVTDGVRDTLEQELRDHPLTTLAVAAGVGFLFGAAWRR